VHDTFCIIILPMSYGCCHVRLKHVDLFDMWVLDKQCNSIAFSCAVSHVAVSD